MLVWQAMVTRQVGMGYGWGSLVCLQVVCPVRVACAQTCVDVQAERVLEGDWLSLDREVAGTRADGCSLPALVPQWGQVTHLMRERSLARCLRPALTLDGNTRDCRSQLVNARDLASVYP